MVIVLGGSGYVGSPIVRSLELQGIRVQSLSRKRINYFLKESLHEAISGATFLINAAGYTGRPNVDACEQYKTDCLLANTVLPGMLREVCDDAGLPWIHISSGCIYTGTRPDGLGFRETDLPNFCFRTNNCSFYSGTKALGEELLEGAEHCYVLRLRIPFDQRDHERNYLSKLLRYERLLEAENSLSSLEEFVASCLHCINTRPDPGIYNVVNSGAVKTSDVVAKLMVHGICRREIRYFPSEDVFLREAAKTPRSNCILDNTKALAAGFPLSSVDEALDRSLAEWLPREQQCL